MASKRCLPTRFFKDADIMNVSKDAQLILVGLVLLADDEGRELAHPRLLSREIDYPPEQIESALKELVENDLVVLYQAGKHSYYSLTRWNQWQSISSQKMTPSKCPAPPVERESEAVPSAREEEHDAESEHVRHMPEIRREMLGNAVSAQGNVGNLQGNDGIPPGNSGKNREIPSQYNLSESNLIQVKRIEVEGATPPNVVPFPTARDDANDELETKNGESEVIAATKQVAAILNISVTERLQRVVADYLGDPSLSLLGEADAAREWIEDPRRNRKRKQLTPAFFRCWLKREHETVQRGYGSGDPFRKAPAGGTALAPDRVKRTPANGTGPPGDRPGTRATEQIANPYQAYVNARAQEVMRRALSRQEAVRYEASP
jgi:hypothetical protein